MRSLLHAASSCIEQPAMSLKLNACVVCQARPTGEKPFFLYKPFNWPFPYDMFILWPGTILLAFLVSCVLTQYL